MVMWSLSVFYERLRIIGVNLLPNPVPLTQSRSTLAPVATGYWSRMRIEETLSMYRPASMPRPARLRLCLASVPVVLRLETGPDMSMLWLYEEDAETLPRHVGFPTLTHAAALNPRQSVRYPCKTALAPARPALPAPASPQCGQQRMVHALGGTPPQRRRGLRDAPRAPSPEPMRTPCAVGSVPARSGMPRACGVIQERPPATLTPAGAGRAGSQGAARRAGALRRGPPPPPPPLPAPAQSCWRTWPASPARPRPS